MHVEAIVPWTRRIRSVAAVLAGEALTLPYFRSRTMHQWVEDVVRRERIERAFVFSSPMAQYVLDLPGLRTVVDFVDMDSAKWDDYARRKPWPVSALYRREAQRLLAFEKHVAARAEASLFVTREEAQLFSQAAPGCANRILAIENGVDGEYFPRRMGSSRRSWPASIRSFSPGPWITGPTSTLSHGSRRRSYRKSGGMMRAPASTSSA